MSSRGKPVTSQIKSQRRKEAQKRTEEYNKLSLKEKLAKLPQEGCKRQRVRLEALINKPAPKEVDNSTNVDSVPAEPKKAKKVKESK